jgi:hypothetical protein
MLYIYLVDNKNDTHMPEQPRKRARLASPHDASHHWNPWPDKIVSTPFRYLFGSSRNLAVLHTGHIDASPVIGILSQATRSIPVAAQGQQC